MDREKQVPESIRQAELDFHFVPEMTKEEALMYAPLTLAFLGDAVYELAIRTDLVQEADRSPNMLNRLSSALAKAGAIGVPAGEKCEIPHNGQKCNGHRLQAGDGV